MALRVFDRRKTVHTVCGGVTVFSDQVTRCLLCGGHHVRTVVRGIRDWEYGFAGEWSYVRCGACGIVQLEPFPRVEELEESYGAEYEPYVHSERTGVIFRLLKRLVDRVWSSRLRSFVAPGQRVLDVGCGEGEMLSRLASIGAIPCGLDFSTHAVERARMRGFQVFAGTFSEYVAAESPTAFDVILMKDYLEHSLDPRGDLVLARRSVADGGRIVITVPNYNAFDRLLFGRFWGGNHAPRHTFQFTPTSLSALLTQSGFDVMSVRSDPSPTCFALSLQNVLQRSRVLAGRSLPLRGGRAWYYTLLLLMFAPIHVLLMPTRSVGFMVLTARAA